MTRYTKIYSDFNSRINEVCLLRKKAAALERSPKSTSHGAEIAALCRAAIVLLSSHIEAYIKELGEHTLDSAHTGKIKRTKIAPQFFYHVSRKYIKIIKDSNNPETIAKNVQIFIDKDAPYWQGDGPIHGPISAKDFNQGFSNPKFEEVQSYLGRFGYVDFYKDFMRSLKKRGEIVEKSLDGIVDARNLIAHGDPSATKTPHEVKEMENIAKEFCRTVDQIFAIWCKKYFYKIR